MARTKEFDPELALGVAVKVFWRLGYERTSLGILIQEMGISKQSLYDTFGDKRSLYLQAMRHYRSETNNGLRALFAREASVKKGFAKLFRAMAQESKEQQEQGCLLLSANLSRDTADEEIKDFLRENQREVEEIFRDALVRARERGEIGPGKKPAALAKYFVATLQGMRALARLNHDREELKHIAAVALTTLDS